MGGAAGRHGPEGGARPGLELEQLERLGLGQLERPAMSEWRHRLPASAGATGVQPVALVRCRRSLRCCASKTYPFSSNSSCRPFTTRTITTTTTTTTHIAISNTINISLSSSPGESQASESKAFTQWLSTVAAQPENPRLSASSPRLSASGPNLFKRRTRAGFPPFLSASASACG